YARDGIMRPVKGDPADNFCLDGMRLVAVGGGDYRTDPDTVSRILSTKDASGVASWIVYRKDGLIDHYGESADSVLQANGKRLTWSINKREDRDGNFVAYSYDNIHAFSYTAER